jgi:subtilisin family serine protease
VDRWVDDRRDPYKATDAAIALFGGINAPLAWDISRGQGVIVAVIDTGVVNHPDLAANVIQGYDFIFDAVHANDGNGRDADPSDAGFARPAIATRAFQHRTAFGTGHM